jgi:hypothetical protein
LIDFKNKSWFFYAFLASVLYALLILFSIRNGPVFAGDSLQYLKMANQVRNGFLPQSDNWLPLYSFFVGVNSFFVGNLFDAVIFTNILFIILLVFLINYFICFLELGKSSFLFGNLFIFSDRELYLNSLSIMAELPTLVTFLSILILMFRLFSENKILNNKYFLCIVVISLLASILKYNYFPMIIIVLIFVFKNRISLLNKIKYSLIYLLALFVSYSSWFLWNQKFVFKSIYYDMKLDVLGNFKIGLTNLFSVLIEYNLSSKYADLISHKVGYMVLSLILIIIVAFILIDKSIKGLKGVVWFWCFICAYVIMYFFVCIATGNSQIDIRQMFYPLFLINLIIVFTLLKLASKKSWFYYMLIAVFLSVGLLKTHNRMNAFLNTGYGDLTKEMKNPETLNVIKGSKGIIKSYDINLEFIYTNKYKTLGILFDYQEFKRLPNSGTWGLSGFKYSEKTEEYPIVINEIIKNNGLIIYILDDFESQYMIYSQYLNKNIVIKKYNDGFVAYRKPNIRFSNLQKSL